MIWQNSGNITIPEYLNEDFFTNALEEGLRELQIGIDEISVTYGSKPGENYCSSIYRMVVTYHTARATDSSAEEKRRISLIVKTIPMTRGTQFLQDVGVFIQEKIIYNDILPCLNALIDGDKFGAKCLYALKSPVQTIVFTDLTMEGFTMASRQDGLDWNHASLILQQLGKFHATSMVLAKRDPLIVEKFNKGMLCEETVLQSDSYMIIFGSYLKQIIQESKTWPDFEVIREKLQNYYDNFKDITYRLAKAKEGDRIFVLNHGDLWTNNFMFAYKDDSNTKMPTNSIFVDFQLSFYGSPGCDLNFFLNTSIPLKLLKDRRDDLIACYYKSFADTLQFLRFPSIPSMDDVKYEMRARESYGLFALFGFLPMVTMPKEDSSDASIDSLTNDEMKDKKITAMFARESLHEHLRYGLKRLEALGVLDEF